MGSISISLALALLVLGIVLLLWTIKLKLPKREKVLELVFLALSMAGLLIYFLLVLILNSPLNTGSLL